MDYLIAYVVPAIIVLLAIPMALGKVPPNGLYGFRTPKTMSSSDIWYPANRVAGVFMIAAAILSIVVNSVLLAMSPDWPDSTLSGWMSVSLIAPLLLSLVGSFVYLRRL